MQSSPQGLLIFETEADTISNMLKQDWGNFSDVLRKAFHHETISISREIDEKFFEIKDPKLSLVLSGTPGQIAPLISSQENGLFSRFIFYYFDEPTFWKDVSPDGDQMDINQLFENAGDSTLINYNKLINRQTPVEFKLTKEQWAKFNETMNFAVSSLISIHNTEILPTIKRKGVIMFRFCMILTFIRIEDIDEIGNEIYCTDDDFNTALAIIKTTIDHSIIVSSLFKEVSKVQKLNMNESIIFSQLNKHFTRKQVLDIGQTMKIPERTLDYMIYRFTRVGLITKVSNGNFQKL